jgi:hypothetical protein
MVVIGKQSSVAPTIAKQQKLFFVIPAGGGGIPETSNINSITVEMKPVRPLGPDFNLFGWYPGWLSIYLISSIGFSALFRKYLKVY